MIYSRMRRHATKLTRIFIFIALSLSLANNARSNESSAFSTLNLSPMVQIFGLPSLENKVLGHQGAFKLELEQQIANYHSQSILTSEAILLDGETWRTSLNASYALTDQSQFSISIPYIRHSGGHLDDLIYNWHDTFELPQGQRREETNGNINILYAINGNNTVSQHSPVTGVGDVRLKYGYMLPVGERALILQSELKLPTGNIDRLTGSGGTDVSLGFMIDDKKSVEEQNASLWYGGAATYIEDAKSHLSATQNNMIFSARAGLGWTINRNIVLKTQLDTHSAVYDSDTKELGEAALMLTLGGDIYFSQRYKLELSGVEDIATDSSPDIIFTAKITASIQ